MTYRHYGRSSANWRRLSDGTVERDTSQQQRDEAYASATKTMTADEHTRKLQADADPESRAAKGRGCARWCRGWCNKCLGTTTK